VSDLLTITLPALGDFDEIEIIVVLIVPGDEIEAEDSTIILESDKATMEIPSPYSGKVMSVHVKVGDRISEGTIIAKLESAEVKQDEPVVVESEQVPAAVKEAIEIVTETENENEATAEKKVVAEEKTVKLPPVAPTRHVENQSNKLIHASPSI